ncbi:putative NRPS-like protein biosynthetic cluster [Aspergillus brasiliensis]|uniref:NRPS-like protein biosynthetic cluster n=1 Tax=Aspergillus brasiliensis TaxID=319629 RepID=A0A9W5YVM8_9EURO|nr:putative NRPS-like protein biosynthetic cluster [Aspergillus brasiliensis]
MTPFVRPTVNLQPTAEESVRTLPELVDFHHANNPDHVFCLQAHCDDGDDNHRFTEIRYSQLKPTINQCQKWLNATIPEISTPTHQADGTAAKCAPVALFMENDVGLAIYALSLMGMGVPVILLSTRLSALAVGHLLQATGAGCVMASARQRLVISEALKTDQDRSIPVYDPESYELFLSTSADSHLQENESIAHVDHFVSETDRNVLILHSSGTTGLPKPIYCSHRHLLGFARCHEFDTPEVFLGVLISTSPFFHGFGLVPMCLSLGVGKPFCIPPSSIIPTGDSVARLMEDAGAKALLTVPSILEEIALLPDDRGIRALQRLDFVAFGGGLPKEVIGQRLMTAGVRLINHYGATETGPLTPFYQPPPGHDWHFFALRTDTMDVLQVRLDPVDETEQQVRAFKMSMQPFGWQERFELQDLLIGNSDGSSNSFTAAGRTDDLICLATGEKVRPTILEDLLQQTTGVKAATAFGNGQFELGVIIETTALLPLEQHDAFKQEIWPVVEEAGRRMDSHGQISSPTAILIVAPGTLPRSDKGTVVRKEVYRLFADDIQDVYRQLEVNVTAPALDVANPASTIRSLVLVNINLPTAGPTWSDDEDLFELGMDSLQAVKLRRLLAGSVKAARGSTGFKPEVSRDFVYRNPSVNKMARALTGAPSEPNDTAEATFDQLVDEFSSTSSGRQQRRTVLLTGSTGSLGSYLLSKLLETPSVDSIICLNRPSTEDGQTRQKRLMISRGINIPEDSWSRVLFMRTNISLPHLGLDESQYAHLTAVITDIIHAAWPMSFNRTLPSFTSAFKTLQTLIELSIHTHRSRPWLTPRFLFISSISTVGHYPTVYSEHIVPETPTADRRCALPLGYAQAKLVCEKIIERARCNHPEVEMGFVRVGQIAGAHGSGYWNPEEHFVAVVRSAQTLRVLPDLRGTLSWLPVDTTAAVLLEILFHPAPLRLVYHLENPIRQSWQDVLDVLAVELGISRTSVRPLKEWLELVEGSGDDGNSAKDLVGFLRYEFERMSCGGVVLGTEGTRGVSPTLRRVGAVSDETIRGYVRYWKECGVI